MRVTLACLVLLAPVTQLFADDQPLTPLRLNALLPKVTAGMTSREVTELLAMAYPKVECHLGLWSGQTGYIDFKLDDRHAVSIAAASDPKRGTVVHNDIRIYVLDHPHKCRVEIKPYHWKD